jgi:hypothetical protein
VNVKTFKNGGGIKIKVNILLKYFFLLLRGSGGECLKPFFIIIKGGGLTLELK